jgi:two-component system response regulator HydG
MGKRILVVDDDRSLCETIEADMTPRGFEVAWRVTAEEAFADLASGAFDAVLTDLRMPGMDGIELCDRITANYPDVPVVVATAFGSLDTAIEAIRAGAYDFVTKPIELDVLALALERAVRHRALQHKVQVLSEVVEQSKRFGELLGVSPVMQGIYDKLARVAETDVTVLITGESGTGKELAARALHDKGPRCDGPFVAINCSAVPESLLESELFGHVRGAFTDAKTDNEGLFRQAQGGTLFLDEIADLSLALQPKVLRALEERVVRPVGSSQEFPIDLRLIAATNHDIESDVEEGRFREDLFFRINVVQIVLPPLRSRGSDILLLAQHFAEELAARFGKPVEGISQATAEKLLDYDWPGNVRELRNAMERAVALTRYRELSVDDLPERIRDYRTSRVLVESNDPAELLTMGEVERRYIQHVLQATGGNKTLAACVLGLDRKTLYRKLERYAEQGEAPSQ